MITISQNKTIAPDIHIGSLGSGGVILHQGDDCIYIGSAIAERLLVALDLLLSGNE